ncbi:hypothetical protein QTJ16_007058 [Diplocarpon rosae]|uniref:Uncharacterized protein n=1 Tax=Diplocarpon rosae TaxID=946125 RepID=A0AAD9SUU4_9HELO|nr:hypothetical protein QTJ16_007058 [Diplocarpon rosae]
MVPAPPLDYEVLIIGAGLSGMYSLIKMRELGLRVRVIEAGSDVGGTWYWNRYPGARFDSESVSYGFSFSKELLEEWKWEESFSAQPETEKYCQFVCEKFDLRRDITFDCRICRAHFRPSSRSWELSSDGGAQRVAVVGTGATGIQTIQTIAKRVAHLTVFQRQPNWSKPLHNTKISDEEMAQIRRRYPEIFQRCAETANAFLHGSLEERRRTVDVPREEREAFWEKLGQRAPLRVHRQQDPLARHDPAVAAKLIPTNHGVGTKRLPLESHYFEVYNQPNVELVDLRETPLERITARGIQTSAREHAVDVIVYATGFDAITGAFDAIDFVGVDGAKLREAWQAGPQTYLGMTVPNFPNMFMIMGPHQAMGNIPPSIEYAVGWVASLLRFCREGGLTWVEPTPELAAEWLAHGSGAPRACSRTTWTRG